MTDIGKVFIENDLTAAPIRGRRSYCVENAMCPGVIDAETSGKQCERQHQQAEDDLSIAKWGLHFWLLPDSLLKRVRVASGDEHSAPI